MLQNTVNILMLDTVDWQCRDIRPGGNVIDTTLFTISELVTANQASNSYIVAFKMY